MLYLSILLIFVFFAGVAMTIGEGLWSNAVNLLAIILAGLAAISVGGPLGAMLCEKFEKPLDFLWYFVFAATWLSFFITVLLIRIAAERLSTVRVRFVPPLEAAGGPLMGLFVALMFASFTAFTLLAMPIAAGEWNIQQASSWQQSLFQQGSSPFFTVAKRFLGDDGVKHFGLSRE